MCDGRKLGVSCAVPWGECQKKVVLKDPDSTDGVLHQALHGFVATVLLAFLHGFSVSRRPTWYLHARAVCHMLIKRMSYDAKHAFPFCQPEVGSLSRAQKAEFLEEVEEANIEADA